jgi:hypothetical protein
MGSGDNLGTIVIPCDALLAYVGKDIAFPGRKKKTWIDVF